MKPCRFATTLAVGLPGSGVHAEAFPGVEEAHGDDKFNGFAKELGLALETKLSSSQNT